MQRWARPHGKGLALSLGAGSSAMDLGSDLRQARERAGLSLSDIAARTKIPPRHLASIENNEFDTVPAGIFLRSFIRTYAREVQVDPEAAIAEYRSMTDPITEF